MNHAPGHPVRPLQLPAEIDAHLAFAALDGDPATLQCGGREVAGRFDLADGFGVITFLPLEPDLLAFDADVEVRYWREGALWRFTTRAAQCAGPRRWQLRRPRLVETVRGDGQAIAAAR